MTQYIPRDLRSEFDNLEKLNKYENECLHKEWAHGWLFPRTLQWDIEYTRELLQNEQ